MLHFSGCYASPQQPRRQENRAVARHSAACVADPDSLQTANPVRFHALLQILHLRSSRGMGDNFALKHRTGSWDSAGPLIWVCCQRMDTNEQGAWVSEHPSGSRFVLSAVVLQRIIRESWAILAVDLDKLGALIFERIFEVCPVLGQVFSFGALGSQDVLQVNLWG